MKIPHPKNKLNKLVLGLPDVRAEDEFDEIEVERCRLENDLDELLPLLGSLWLLEKDTDLLLRVILFQKKKMKFSSIFCQIGESFCFVIICLLLKLSKK